MKRAPHSKAGFSRYENQISSAIMLLIVFISMAVFATVAWNVAKLVLP